MFNTKYGKTIKLFLMDADPDGRMICELSNWTGKAYRIPRGKVKDCADRDELKSTAVYLLFGRAESSTAKAKVYIGEAENVYSRLVQHISEKEFWNESVVFISKDENLRDELIESETIKNIDGKYIFTSDYLFSSPSTAAAVVMGRSANGLIEWKDVRGKDLKFIEEQEIQKANKALNMDAAKKRRAS